MSKAAPTIQKYMTCNPIVIQADETLLHSQNIMEDQGIRHLPVMDGELVFGILSDRDLKLAAGLLDMPLEKIKVEDICQTHLYTANPDAALDSVVSEMAEHHYGSAVIVQNSKLVGIFTTVDACRALADVLHQRFH